MKARLSLSGKILFTAFLNLLLLAVVFLVFARVQFRSDPHSFLLAPAQDRILAVARELALELEETETNSRDRLLARYAQAHSVAFYLFDEEGTRLAGPAIQMPWDVVRRLRPRAAPPPPRFGERREPGDGDRPPPRPPPAGQRPPGAADRPAQRQGQGVFLETTSEPRRYWVGVRIPIRSASNDETVRGTLLLMSPALLGNRLFFDFRPWLIAIFAVILVSVACWLPLIRGMTQSISQMTRATEQIAEGQFDVQVATRRRDEIGQLGGAINRMASRLSGFVTGQKRFLGDIAHELCSPIARIQLALGILDQRAEEKQRGCVADLNEEVQYMSVLVNELLSFSKAGMRPAAAELVPVNVGAIVERVIEREAAPGVRVETAVDEHLEALADPDYLFRALSNLVRNAVRYAGPAGPITVSARAENGAAVITVSDCGPGLAEDALEQVFVPFYRPETSRSRDTGGVGLGLAIVKTCIESCKGSVTCRNRQPSGLEVEIRLKAAP